MRLILESQDDRLALVASLRSVLVVLSGHSSLALDVVVSWHVHAVSWVESDFDPLELHGVRESVILRVEEVHR